MAGSNKWFVYTTDFGDDYAFFADESNTEALNETAGDYPANGELIYSLPKNVKPRHVIYQNANGTRSIKCYALTTARYTNAIETTPTIPDPITDGETLTIARLVPERISPLPKGTDTGLNEGDNT